MRPIAPASSGFNLPRGPMNLPINGTEAIAFAPIPTKAPAARPITGRNFFSPKVILTIMSPNLSSGVVCAATSSALPASRLKKSTILSITGPANAATINLILS